MLNVGGWGPGVDYMLTELWQFHTPRGQTVFKVWKITGSSLSHHGVYLWTINRWHL